MSTRLANGRHPSWYDTIHAWMRRNHPKTGTCAGCGASSKTEWALIHGREYSRDRDDYRELCRKCHSRYDLGGGNCHSAVLTLAQVTEIRAMYKPGKSAGRGEQPGSARALARKFGVNRTTIKAIVTNQSWVRT
jgi:hypothetical protein